MSATPSRTPAPGARGASTAPGAGSGFWRRFWPVFTLGLVGVASLPLVIVPMLRYVAPPPGLENLPRAALVLVSLVNPVLLLVAAALVGAALAHRVGFRSHAAARVERDEPLWPRLRAELPAALGMGVVLGVAMGVLDLLFRPVIGDVWLTAETRMGPRDVASLVSGMLYGGLTEEVQLRWGLLSLVAWLGWRLVQKARGPLAGGVAWGAILVAALLFGASHLPAVAALAPLTGWLVARTVLINALAGVVLGWLYWRRSLESAMMAHAAAHVGLLLLRLAG